MSDTKISNLKIEHFRGIIDELEIDFCISKKPESLLLYGDNGSGMVNLRSTNQYPLRLRNGEQISEYFTDEASAIQSLKSNRRIYAYVKDSEGKIYRKKMNSK